MRLQTIAKTLLIALVGAFFAGCGDAPTNPSPGIVVDPTLSTPPPGPTGPLGPSLQIEGPDVVPLGQTVQFRLIARLADGSQRDVTEAGTWTPGWGPAVTIEGPGQVHGSSPGENQIEARFEDHQDDKQVLVVPAGTYRLVGRVLEADVPSAGVVGATVEVSSGTGAGRVFAHTDTYGFYRLYGVAGPTTLRVSKEGYEAVDHTLVVEDNYQEQEITLRLRAPRVQVAGTYTLTIRAAQKCGVGLGPDNLPQEVRVRTYAAVVQQDGPTLAVTLTSASLIRGQTEFRGWVEPGRVVFDLVWNGWEPHLIEEQLPQSRLFRVDGVGVINPQTNGLAGRFGGTLLVVDPSGPTAIATCTSPDHGFTLTP
jgi:hypothetical protein